MNARPAALLLLLAGAARASGGGLPAEPGPALWELRLHGGFASTSLHPQGDLPAPVFSSFLGGAALTHEEGGLVLGAGWDATLAPAQGCPDPCDRQSSLHLALLAGYATALRFGLRLDLAAELGADHLRWTARGDEANPIVDDWLPFFGFAPALSLERRDQRFGLCFGLAGRLRADVRRDKPSVDGGKVGGLQWALEAFVGVTLR